MKYLWLSILFAGLAAASTVSVSFTNGNQSGSPGDTLTFGGILTNGGGETLFINEDSILLDSPLTFDDSPFLQNAPLSLDPSQASDSFTMFSVMIPLNASGGPFLGTIEILGGPGSSDFNVIGSADFSVTLTQSSAAPEPPTWCAGLMLLGMTWLLWRGAGAPVAR